MSSTIGRNCKRLGAFLTLAGVIAASIFSASAATIQVRVGGNGQKFTPQDVTVQPGDTVQWKWAGDDHSVTSGTKRPDGLFDSGVQDKGYIFSYTFNDVGTYPYFCTVHAKCCGMVGSVTVSQQTSGAGQVFVNANATANAVYMYTRGTDGMLTFVNSFSTQGTGGGKSGLSSQGSIALARNNTLLYAVNADSNDITGFQVSSTGLTFVSKTASGGTFPTSIAVYGNFLYVLNTEGSAENISGYTIQSDGTLTPIPNSILPLSSASPTAAQIGFTPDGGTLIVSEKVGIFDTYSVDANGVATGPTPQSSAAGGPFGFAFDAAGYLVVSNLTNSSASSYLVNNGVLQAVTRKLKDNGKAACWTVCTTIPTLAQQYAYITNTNSDSVSGLAISSTGALTLLPDNGKTAVLPKGAFPIDEAISSDNQYLYVLEKKLPGIGVFQIGSDGSLTQIQTVSDTPASAYGMIGY